MKLADEVTEMSRMLMLLGPPKNGKTVCAATVSSLCPKELPAPQKTYLKDTVWIQFDTNGIESLRHLNLIPYVIDLSRVVEYGMLKRKLTETIKEIKEQAEKGAIKNVVIDTISTMDTVMLSHLRKIYPDIKLQGLMYNTLLGLHMDFAMQLKSLPVTTVIIAHTKVTMGMGDAQDMAARKKSAGLPGGGDIVAEISGKAANHYKGASDCIWPVLKKSVGGKEKFVVLPYGGYGFEGGCRYNGLGAEEPANLQEIFRKVNACDEHLAA
jgi:hypothetical protein